MSQTSDIFAEFAFDPNFDAPAVKATPHDHDEDHEHATLATADVPRCGSFALARRPSP
jgi:hypothetical protein